MFTIIQRLVRTSGPRIARDEDGVIFIEVMVMIMVAYLAFAIGFSFWWYQIKGAA